MTAVDEYVRTTEAMVESGATYRQIEYWVNQGYLKPVNAGKGTGFPWLWSAEELAVVKRMIALLGCGMQVEAAAAMARDRAELQRAYLTLVQLLAGES